MVLFASSLKLQLVWSKVRLANL